MVITNTKPAAAVLAVSSVLSSAPFGIPLNEIGWGAVFFAIGILGRAAVEILSCVERGDPLDRKLFLRWGVWVVMGTVGSVFVSCLWIAFVMSMGWTVSPWTVVILLGLGYGGPKAINKFADLVNNMATTKFSIVGGKSESDVGGKNDDHH